jgi:hypothetical protein
MILKNNRATAVSKSETGQAGMILTHQDENINMYNEPPQNIISLHEFYKIALDRLQVLKKIEFM